LNALGLREAATSACLGTARRFALPLYLGSLLIALGVVAWLMLSHAPSVGSGLPLWLSLLGAALMVFPASEAVVAVINRLISESVRPGHLPRLSLSEGIPPSTA
jgi:cyclic beta-1,2-glucan synthetase